MALKRDKYRAFLASAGRLGFFVAALAAALSESRKFRVLNCAPIFMPLRFTRRRIFQLVFAGAALATLSGGAFYSRLKAQPRNVITQLAPGLSLQSVETTAPTGPLKFWLVKADPKLFDLGLEVADKTNVVKKRSVRNLAAQSKSIVAINGGFFAYGGAAVGAVKVKGEWHRLPWRNRTALGWNDKNALISPLQGRLEISLSRDSATAAEDAAALRAGAMKSEAALNGFNLPGQRAAIVNGFSLLSRNFSPTYTLKTGETAAAISSVKADNQYRVNGIIRMFGRQQRVGKITTFYQAGDEVPLDAQDYLLVARGTMATWLLSGANAPDTMRMVISYEPTQWDNYPTIVGAGPRLVANGGVQTNEREEEFLPDVIARGPRTAVGWDKDKNWLFLVADGRQATSVGLTIPETAVLFAQLGAVEAMNLDGGSSTQLIINGELANNPSALDPVNPTRPREVQVSNALTLKAK